MQDEDKKQVQADIALLTAEAVELDGGTLPPVTQESDGESLPLPSAPPEEKDLNAIKGALGVGVTMAAALVCPNWHLTPEEIDAVSDAGAAAIDHYFPDTNLDHPLAALALVMAGVAGPRLVMGIPMRQPKEQDSKPEQGPETLDEPVDKPTLVEG
ncbi:hypothetical protein [Photobacterium salinisoli]|uniref:hypothetical protein n=1 Tax=Photobacterium salinisoli TaxID=1616783 RepID=UPI000EA0370E|nr:hypothetical protein [Photobacterium salinisoli]